MNKKYLLLIALLFALPVYGQAPSQVTLTWSTDTYIPLGYFGKALPTRGSSVEVVAGIDSKTNPQDLFYNWFINDHLQESKSGKDKQVLKFNLGDAISQDYEIRVRVSDKKESFILSSSLTITPKEPEIILESEIQPLESLKSIRSYLTSSNQSVEFTARPYFFNINHTGDLNYAWNFGGKEAGQTESDNPNIFTLEIGELIESITRNLTIWVENKKNFLQSARSTIEINIVP